MNDDFRAFGVRDGVYLASDEAQKAFVEWLMAHGVERTASGPLGGFGGLELRVNPYVPASKAVIVSGEQVRVIDFGAKEGA